MAPLVTRQGLKAAELVSLVGGRDVLVWGSGDMALDVLTSLTKAGIQPKAFLRTGSMASGSAGTLHGLPIWVVKDVLVPPVSVFVVIATTSFRQQAEAECLNLGLRKNADFISHLSIPRPQAIVEIMNNGHRASLWESRVRRTVPAFMSAEAFARVLDKLTLDLPLLCHLELALWGEPLRNPDLPRILDVAQRVVPCTVATSLAVDVPIDPVVRAKPSRFDITASGFDDSYEPALPGASWQMFMSMFESLRASIEKHRPNTRFQVKLYRSRHDDPEIEHRWRDLLHGSGIGLSLQTPYVMPYDYLLLRCETGSCPDHVRRAIDALPWNPDRVLEQCLIERHRPCLSQRIFPIINTDLSVSLCHLYEEPIIANDYLSIAWDDLLLARHRSHFCGRCQQFGLHRLDIEVLVREHPHRKSEFFLPTGEA